MRRRRCGWSIRTASRWVSLGGPRGQMPGPLVSGLGGGWASGAGAGRVVSDERLLITLGRRQDHNGPKEGHPGFPGPCLSLPLLCSQSAQI